MLPYSSTKKAGWLLFQEVKAMWAPAAPQVRTNLQSSQLTRQPAAGEVTDLSNNFHNLEVITNTYKTPLPLTFATLQL